MWEKKESLVEFKLWDPGWKTMKRRKRFSFGSTSGLLLSNLILMGVSVIFWLIQEDPPPSRECGFNGTPVKEETISYEATIEAAMEIFQYMSDQRIGKAKIWDLDFPARPIRDTWCFRYPDRPKSQPGFVWQTVPESFPQEIYLWEAFLDSRPSEIYPSAKGMVQILAMARRVITGKLYCFLWAKGEPKPRVVESFYRHIWQRAWDPRNRFYTPWLVSCPTKNSDVEAVSISTRPCPRSLANFLRVHDSSSREEKEVVVCVKGMDFLEDTSDRLVEWFELQFLLGADKVLLYTYAVHPRSERVIRYYEKHRNVQRNEKALQIKLSLPGSAPLLPYQRSRFIWRNRQQKRRNEIVPYNDCLYRHIHSHRYILIIDTDEIVVPQAPLQNWTELLAKIQTDSDDSAGLGWTAFSIRNAFFFRNFSIDSDIPEHFYMLRHTERSAAISAAGQYGKSFVATRNAATVFNHYPLHKQHSAAKRTYYVKPNLALKLHYKSDCPIESRDECPDLYRKTVRDRSLERFSRAVMENAERVRRELNGGLT